MSWVRDRLRRRIFREIFKKRDPILIFQDIGPLAPFVKACPRFAVLGTGDVAGQQKREIGKIKTRACVKGQKLVCAKASQRAFSRLLSEG